MYNPLLKTFVCVADCGSFSRAAGKLFISVPAVQKQVNALESHLGVRLLERTRRGVSLTEAGSSIYADALRRFALAERAVAKARQYEQSARKIFRVGTSMLYPGKFFMDLWQKIEHKLPGYTIQIVPFADHHAEIINELRRIGEKYDFIVGPCDSDFWKSICSYHILGHLPLCVAVPKGHRLAERDRLTLTDLYDETVLAGGHGDSPVIDRARTLLAQHPHIHIEDVPHFYDAGTFNRSEREKKILLTLDCWRDVHPSLVTIAVDWDFAVPYGILYPKQPAAHIQQFFQVLRDLLP